MSLVSLIFVYKHNITACICMKHVYVFLPMQMWMSVCPRCVEFTAAALTHLAVSAASVLQGFRDMRTAPAAPVKVRARALLLLIILISTSVTSNVSNHVKMTLTETVFPSSLSLSDINECSDPDVCGTNANCSNHQGSYSCKCHEGYSNYGNNQSKCISENYTTLFASF